MIYLGMWCMLIAGLHGFQLPQITVDNVYVWFPLRKNYIATHVWPASNGVAYEISQPQYNIFLV